MSIKVVNKFFRPDSYLLPIFSGLILSFGLFYPIFIFLFVFLLPFFNFIEKNQSSRKKLFWGGFLFGFSFALFSLIMGLYPSLELLNFLKAYPDLKNNFISNADILLLILFLGLSPLIGFVYGLFAIITSFFFKKESGYSLIAVPSLWILSEFLRRKILFDLSWGDLGYNFIDYPIFVATSRIWGKYGIAFFVILFNVLIFFLATKKLELTEGLFLLLIIFLGVNILGVYLLKNDFSNKEKLKIAVLQGYIPWQTEIVVPNDNDPFFFPFPYNKLIDRLKKSGVGVDIILLPEEVLHFNPISVASFDSPLKIFNETNYWLTEKKAILEVLKETGAKIFIIGQPLILNLNSNYQASANSFLIFDNQGNVYAYIKKRLFPFIERRPIFRFDFVGKGGYQPGELSPFLKINNLNIALLSCIEIENDGLLNRYLGNEPSIILTGGSEIGFNDLAKKYQLKMTRFRAVEQNKYVARATKRGYSAIIDPWGEVLKKVETDNQDAILIDEVYLKSGKTFYSKIGDEPIVIFALWVVLLGFLKNLLYSKI